MVFLSFFVVPALVALTLFIVSHLRDDKAIHISEFLGQIGIGLITAFLTVLAIYFQNTVDTEIWSGKIVAKKKEKVSCSHSYCCSYGQCCSGTGKNRSCRSCCKRTCYEHPYDFSWAVYSAFDKNYEKLNRLTISRVDRQGLMEPERWTQVKVGEPAAKTNNYLNYLKAGRNSLFRRTAAIEGYEELIPEYPAKVFDYYRVNRVILIDKKISPKIVEVINQRISEYLIYLGPSRQANIMIVLTSGHSDKLFYAIEEAWEGGKKNDITTVIGLSENNEVEWVRVMTLTRNNRVKVEIESEISNWQKYLPSANKSVVAKEIAPNVKNSQFNALPLTIEEAALSKGEEKKVDVKIQYQIFVDIIAKAVTDYYDRKPMAEFEYLKYSVVPTGTQFIIGMLLNMFLSIGLGCFFYFNDFKRYN